MRQACPRGTTTPPASCAPSGRTSLRLGTSPTHTHWCAARRARPTHTHWCPAHRTRPTHTHWCAAHRTRAGVVRAALSHARTCRLCRSARCLCCLMKHAMGGSTTSLIARRAAALHRSPPSPVCADSHPRRFTSSLALPVLGQSLTQSLAHCRSPCVRRSVPRRICTAAYPPLRCKGVQCCRSLASCVLLSSCSRVVARAQAALDRLREEGDYGPLTWLSVAVGPRGS
jgi:hypothetical protein